MTNIDMEHQLRKQAEKETHLSIQHKLTAILECRQHFQRNVNRQLALEVLLMQLAD
jgi:DNA polymerase-3 subunit delta'